MPQKQRIKWTREELDALERGMIEYGTNWETILLFYGSPEGPLGIFEKATG